jgi:hypothetical protein
MLSTGTRHGHLLTFIEMREKHVAPQSVAAEFAKMVRPDSPSRRVAILLSGTLHRLQAKQILDDRHAVFPAEDEALAWLMEGDDSATPIAGIAASSGQRWLIDRRQGAAGASRRVSITGSSRRATACFGAATATGTKRGV